MGFGADVRGKNDRPTRGIVGACSAGRSSQVWPDSGVHRPAARYCDARRTRRESASIRILTEPRNALTKQYEKLLSFEKVKLKFTEGASSPIARKAYTQKTGARGLRAILEEVMLDVMYEVPSQKQIKEVVVTEDVILGKSQPIRLFEQDKEMKSA